MRIDLFGIGRAGVGLLPLSAYARQQGMTIRGDAFVADVLVVDAHQAVLRQDAPGIQRRWRRHGQGRDGVPGHRRRRHGWQGFHQHQSRQGELITGMAERRPPGQMRRVLASAAVDQQHDAIGTVGGHGDLEVVPLAGAEVRLTALAGGGVAVEHAVAGEDRTERGQARGDRGIRMVGVGIRSQGPGDGAGQALVVDSDVIEVQGLGGGPQVADLLDGGRGDRQDQESAVGIDHQLPEVLAAGVAGSA